MQLVRRSAFLIPVLIATALVAATTSNATVPVTLPGTGTIESSLVDVTVSNTGSADEVVFTFAGDAVPTVDASFGGPPFVTIADDVVTVPGASFINLRMFPARGASFGASCANALGPPPTPSAGQIAVAAYFTCSEGLTVTEPVVPSARLVPTGTSSQILAATLRQLLAGPSAGDTAAGLGSFFSSATANTLLSATIAPGGAATIDFDPALATLIPNASSSAGSAALLRELDATVFQFLEVTSATYQLGGSCEAFFNFLQRGCTPRSPSDGASATFSVTYNGPETVTGPSVNVTQASQLEDFEAQLTWVIGLSTPTDVTVTTATGPARVIVTVPHLAQGSLSRIYVSNRIASGPADYAILFGRPDQQVIVGDWDGNGADGFGARAGNSYRLANQFGTVSAVVGYGKAGDDVYVGDWDANATDTLAVRRGNVFFLKNTIASGPADVVLGYGKAGDEIFVGDWNGNGQDTFAVRRGNVFFVRNTPTTGIADVVFGYGRAGDEVLVGDWNQDGLDTFAVRRGNVIYIRNDLQTGIAQTVIAYGRAGDQLLVGDYNGDGVDTFAVRRPPP